MPPVVPAPVGSPVHARVLVEAIPIADPGPCSRQPASCWYKALIEANWLLRSIFSSTTPDLDKIVIELIRLAALPPCAPNHTLTGCAPVVFLDLFSTSKIKNDCRGFTKLDPVFQIHTAELPAATACVWKNCDVTVRDTATDKSGGS